MHKSYPTPEKKELDVGNDYKADILKQESLVTLAGEDLMTLRKIASFWAFDSYNGEYNKLWRPVFKRIDGEVQRRLEVGRQDPNRLSFGPGPHAYKPAPIHEVFKLEVEAMLDAVPGAWHQPEDLMKWILTHNYVQKVTLLGKVPRENKEAAE